MNTPNTCGNCGTAITCSCQRRTAVNGAPVCSACVHAYELKLRKKA
jgi:RNA polymerase-binding transcription factor DksA